MEKALVGAFSVIVKLLSLRSGYCSYAPDVVVDPLVIRAIRDVGSNTCSVQIYWFIISPASPLPTHAVPPCLACRGQQF